MEELFGEEEVIVLLGDGDPALPDLVPLLPAFAPVGTACESNTSMVCEAVSFAE